LKKKKKRRSEEDCFYRARPRGGWQGSEGGSRMRRASCCRFLRECVPAYSRGSLRVDDACESQEKEEREDLAFGEDSATPGIAATEPPPGCWVTVTRPCATPARGRAAARARSYINKRSAERRHQKKRRRGTETPLCRAYPALLLQRILTMLERSFGTSTAPFGSSRASPETPNHARSLENEAGYGYTRMLRTNRRYFPSSRSISRPSQGLTRLTLATACAIVG